MRGLVSRLPTAVPLLQRWPRLAEASLQSEPSATLQLRLLGAPSLQLPGSASLVALERKDAALLALLALDGSLSRARAAALLWPDAEPQKARNSLRQRLFRLKRAAGTDVVTEGDALALASDVEHDLAAVDARLASEPAAAIGELLGAFGYEDCAELSDWVTAARERFAAQRRDALMAAATAAEQRGRIAEALQYAERLVADQPLSEQAHRLVMRLHYRRGDRAAALAAYARCAQLLKRELGTAAGTETRELAQLIERSDALPGAAPRRLPTALSRPPLLVGRDAQWNAMRNAWNSGRVALLTGDAGMGKTRLLDDFAQSLGVARVAARPGDNRVPYALLARLLRALLGPTDAAKGASAWSEELAHVLPELGAPPERALNEVRFRQAVLQALAQARPGGAAIDDLHYADAASVELLPLLVGQLPMAIAVRGAESPAALAGWRHTEDSGAIVEIPLPPLTEADVRQLLDSLALDEIDSRELAAPLVSHTGGNPYFVLETLASLVTQPGPGSVRLPAAPSVGALIERRLTQLSPTALRLVRVAALAGADFGAALASAVLAAHPLDLTEPWAELEGAQLLRGDGFVHDLVREVAARAVPTPIAALLHAGIAEHLESQSAAPARIARHWSDAGEWRRAAQWHLRAAGDALRASRRTEEVEQREAAIDCLDRAGDTDAAFDERCAGIESLILVRGVAHTQGVIEAMLTAARTDAQQVAALNARATAALMAADHVTGVASARAAMALAEGLSQRWLRFDAARLLAVGLAQQGNANEGEAVLRPFGALIEAEGTLEQRDRYWSDLSYVLNSARRLRATAAALERAIGCARELGDLAELATLTTNLATVHGNLGEVDRAYELALQARALQADLGQADGPSHGVVEAHIGLYGAALGHYGPALQAFERALTIYRRDGQTLWIAVASNNLAAMLIDLGQFARARKVLAYASPSVAHVVARGVMLLARIARLLGSSPNDELERAQSRLQESSDYYIGALLQLERAEALDASAALSLSDSVAREAAEREYGGIALKAKLLAAQAALRGGDVDEAVSRWRGIAPGQLLQATDNYPPRTVQIGVAILAADGKADAANELLATGVAWINSALAQVPDAFRDSFLHRNAVNRDLLAAARRLR